ncbi:MAG: hypothetical protein CMH49_01900 [Myxococcales bacterium]|nr:hypothetical protein [Myxococcales bacterium]
MMTTWRVFHHKTQYCFTFTLYLLALVFTSILSIKTIHGHAWRGQEIVLFISYDLSSEQVRATLGIPLTLVQSNNVTQNERKSLGLARLSKQVLDEQSLKILQETIKKDLPILAQNKKYTPQIQKIDCILNYPSLARDQKQRFLRTWQSTEIESHSGTQDALVISLTYPLQDPTHFDKLHFLWKSKDWFIKSRSKRKPIQIDAIPSTREALGLIIDPQQITPLTFTPQEPEVIWRSPLTQRLAKADFKHQPEHRRQVHKSKSWWQSFKAYFTSRESYTKSELDQVFKDTHRSIYQAFDLESDERIYQALGQALHGSVLDQVFQSTYDALILREEGGARAKVTHIIPLQLESIQEVDLSRELKKELKILKISRVHYFKYHWRIAGLVEHWGHTHRRVNDYRAFYIFAHLKDDKNRQAIWKIIAVDPISQRRRPELEGGL